MASIVFDFLGRTANLDNAMKESKKKVGDFIHDVEKGTERIDKSFDKMGKSAKDAITKQKDLIKELVADVKKLETALKSAQAGKADANISKQLAQTKTYLAQEQQRLIDLQNEQIRVNQAEGESQKGIIGTLGKWGLSILTVGAAMKTFKAVMESTDSTAIFFKSTLNGLKTSLDYFLKSIATADFSNFIDGMRDAFRAGREFTKAQNELENVRREYDIKEKDLNKEIEEQRRIFYEDDKTALKDKIAAGDAMLDKMKEKSDLEVDLAVRSYNTVAELEKSKNKMSEENIRYAIENYTEVEKIGKEYAFILDIIKEFEKVQKKGLIDKKGGSYIDVNYAKMTAGTSPGSQTYYTSAKDIQGYRDRLAAMEKETANAARLGDIYEQFKRVSDKERQIVTDSIVQIKQAENQFLIESKRVFRMKENMTDQEIAKEKEKIKAYNEVLSAISALKKKGIDRDLEVLKGKYEEDLRTYEDNEKMKSALTEKYNLERIDIQKKYYEKLSLIIPKLSSLTLTNATGKVRARGTGPYTKEGLYDMSGGTEIFLKDADKKANSQKEYNKLLDEEGKLRLEIADAVQMATSELLLMSGVSEDIVDQMNSVAEVIKGIAEEDYVAAVSGALSLIESILSTWNEMDFDWVLKYVDDLMDKYNRLLDKAQRSGNAEIINAEYLKNLEGLLTGLDDKIKTAEYLERHSNFLNEEKRKQEVKDLKDQRDVILQTIEDTKLALQDLMTGGITQNTIADAVADGFTEGGKDGIDNVAEYMNDVLRNAAQEVFKSSILSDPAMQAYIDMVKAALEDKILTPDEQSAIQKAATDMGEKFQPIWASLMGGLENIGTPKGLTGAIKGVTEETAGELAGILRRVSDDVRISRDAERMSVTHLSRIEQNTYQTVEQLQLAVAELKSISSNTKPVYAGDL